VYCVSQCNQGIISDRISYYSNAEMHLLETLSLYVVKHVLFIKVHLIKKHAVKSRYV